MNSDKPLNLLFQACPHLFYELTQQRVPSCELSFVSVELKDIARTADGVLMPKATDVPIWVCEFETKPSVDVILRAQLETALLEMQHYPRRVHTMVIYLRQAPADTTRWPAIRCESLRKLVTALPSSHLLRQVLAPLIVEDDGELEAEAPGDYHAIASHPALTSSQRRLLCDVLLDLVMQRLPHYNSSQFRLMYTLRSFDEMKDTVIARDFIDIGRREGIEQGITAMLLRQATRRFGALPAATQAVIDDLDYLQLEALADQMLELRSLAELEAWLADQV